jgi:uncharacterized protein
MRVFLDTNILFSAILFPNSTPDKALQKAISLHHAITCDYVLDELRRNIAKKFPDKISYVDSFLLVLSMSIEVVKVSYDINDDTIELRDPYDKPVLRAARESKCDVLISGDKDFLESNIKNPKCITAKDFLENY